MSNIETPSHVDLLAQFKSKNKRKREALTQCTKDVTDNVSNDVNSSESFKTSCTYFYIWQKGGHLISVGDKYHSCEAKFTSSDPHPEDLHRSFLYNDLSLNVPLDYVLALQKEALPLDKLPSEFLLDILDKDLGSIVIGIQYHLQDSSSPVPPPQLYPTTVSNDDKNKACDTSTDDNSIKASQCGLSSDSTINETVSQDASSFRLDYMLPPVTITGRQYIPCIVGGIVAINFQYWSRFVDTEFQFRRILNIISIFTSKYTRGLGIGSGLCDALVYYVTKTKIEKKRSAHRIALLKAGIPATITPPPDPSSPDSPVVPIPNPSYDILGLFIVDEISLEVRATNTPAQILYKSKGFTKQNVEEEYYEHGKNKTDRIMHEMVVSIADYKYKS